MITITENEWNGIPKGYKSVWSSDALRGTNYNGKRTWMTAIDGVTTLLIEGVSFQIEISSGLECEMCNEPMTKEQHDYCDICGDCLEGGDCEDDEDINDLMN